jgi:hypothetical protein
MLLKQEPVIYDNGSEYKLGYIAERFERSGAQYVEVRYPGGEATITPEKDVYPLEFFLSKVKAAEFEICSWCEGSGRIDPIENPPYKCDYCKGDGYYTAH